MLAALIHICICDNIYALFCSSIMGKAIDILGVKINN